MAIQEKAAMYESQKKTKDRASVDQLQELFLTWLIHSRVPPCVNFEIQWHSKSDSHCVVDRVSVEREHRNQGIGTNAMRALVQFLDDQKLCTDLIVKSIDEGGLAAFDLVAWYEQFGFVQMGITGAGSVCMQRQCQ